MARMHSRAKGQSGSKKPVTPTNPAWQKYGASEIELLIVKLAKQGIKGSKIGLHLRDTYGIPSVKAVCGKTINKVLESKDMKQEIPEDLFNLMKRSVIIRKHMEANHKDTAGKRGLQLTNSKIMRLVKYYKQSKRLERDWKFDPEKIKLFVE